MKKIISWVLIASIAFINPCFSNQNIIEKIKSDETEKNFQSQKKKMDDTIDNIYNKYFSTAIRKSAAKTAAEEYFQINGKYTKETFAKFMDAYFVKVFDPILGLIKVTAEDADVKLEESNGKIMLVSSAGGGAAGFAFYYAATAYLASQVSWWASMPIIGTIATYFGYGSVGGPPGWLIAIVAVLVTGGIYLFYKWITNPGLDEITNLIEKSLEGQAGKWSEYKDQLVKAHKDLCGKKAEKDIQKRFTGLIIGELKLEAKNGKLSLYSDGNLFYSEDIEYNEGMSFAGIRKITLKVGERVRVKDYEKIFECVKRWKNNSSLDTEWVREY